MIEPGIASHVAEYPAARWEDFTACRVCRALKGDPCLALSGRVAGGRPDGEAAALPRPHAARKLSAAAARRRGGDQ